MEPCGEKEALWHMVHDDGDEEDLEAHEVDKAMAGMQVLLGRRVTGSVRSKGGRQACIGEVGEYKAETGEYRVHFKLGERSERQTFGLRTLLPRIIPEEGYADLPSYRGVYIPEVAQASQDLGVHSVSGEAQPGAEGAAATGLLHAASHPMMGLHELPELPEIDDDDDEEDEEEDDEEHYDDDEDDPYEGVLMSFTEEGEEDYGGGGGGEEGENDRNAKEEDIPAVLAALSALSAVASPLPTASATPIMDTWHNYDPKEARTTTQEPLVQEASLGDPAPKDEADDDDDFRVDADPLPPPASSLLLPEPTEEPSTDPGQAPADPAFPIITASATPIITASATPIIDAWFNDVAASATVVEEEGASSEEYECERGCGFDSFDIQIVEQHETTCTFVAPVLAPPEEALWEPAPPEPELQEAPQPPDDLVPSVGSAFDAPLVRRKVERTEEEEEVPEIPPLEPLLVAGSASVSLPADAALPPPPPPVEPLPCPLLVPHEALHRQAVSVPALRLVEEEKKARGSHRLHAQPTRFEPDRRTDRDRLAQEKAEEVAHEIRIAQAIRRSLAHRDGAGSPEVPEGRRPHMTEKGEDLDWVEGVLILSCLAADRPGGAPPGGANRPSRWSQLPPPPAAAGPSPERPSPAGPEMDSGTSSEEEQDEDLYLAYVCKDRESVKSIAASMKVSIQALVRLNKTRYPELGRASQLLGGTVLLIPGTEDHNTPAAMQQTTDATAPDHASSKKRPKQSPRGARRMRETESDGSYGDSGGSLHTEDTEDAEAQEEDEPYDPRGRKRTPQRERQKRYRPEKPPRSERDRESRRRRSPVENEGGRRESRRRDDRDSRRAQPQFRKDPIMPSPEANLFSSPGSGGGGGGGRGKRKRALSMRATEAMADPFNQNNQGGGGGQGAGGRGVGHEAEVGEEEAWIRGWSDPRGSNKRSKRASRSKVNRGKEFIWDQSLRHPAGRFQYAGGSRRLFLSQLPMPDPAKVNPGGAAARLSLRGSLGNPFLREPLFLRGCNLIQDALQQRDQAGAAAAGTGEPAPTLSLTSGAEVVDAMADAQPEAVPEAAGATKPAASGNDDGDSEYES